MKILYSWLIVSLLSSSSYAALCSRTFTFADGSTLTASQLNTEFNTLISCVNTIDESNVVSGANFDPLVISSTIAGSGIGRNGSTGVLSVNVDNSTLEIDSDTVRVKDAGITTAKIAAANVTRAKAANDIIYALVPTGAVIAFAGTTLPSGFLWADGSAVARVTYSDLFAALGTTHGNGDGVATFNVPDYRGRFLRGVDGSAGLDPDKASRTAMNTGGNSGNNVGSVQGEAYKSHTHTTGTYWDTNNFDTQSGTGGGHRMVSSSSGTGASGGSETRPVNAYVNYIIKY